MASELAIEKVMRILSRNFAGDVSVEKCKLYHAALHDVDDEQLERGVVRVIKEHRGEFIPPVAVIRDACGANARPALDVESLLTKIGRHGSQGHTRWFPPRAETIAPHFPASVVRAYAEVGSTVLFSDNPLTREIAYRDFARALRSASDEDARRILLPDAQESPKLEAGPQPTL